MTHGPRWFRKKKTWALLLTPLLLGALVAFGVDPIVEAETRARLKIFEGYEVTFEDASLRPARLSYRLTHLKILKRSAGGDAQPFVYIDTLGMGVYWKELLRLHLVATMEIDGARINVIAASSEAEQQVGLDIPDFSDKLEAVLPLKVDRVQVRDAEVKFTDKTRPEFPRMWLHALDGTLENLATRAALARGEPTIIAASGTLQQSAEVSAYITADPLAKGLFFAGRVKVANLQMNEFSEIVASESGLRLERGTLDVFAEFECRNGKLSGGVKPVIKNAKVVQGKPGLGNAIKAVLADHAVKLFSGGSTRDVVLATVIPISGELAAPELQLWPAVAGVIRNAFVIGVSETFEQLPKADGGHSALSQLVDALDKGKGPPKAQPDAQRKATR